MLLLVGQEISSVVDWEADALVEPLAGFDPGVADDPMLPVVLVVRFFFCP